MLDFALETVVNNIGKYVVTYFEPLDSNDDTLKVVLMALSYCLSEGYTTSFEVEIPRSMHSKFITLAQREFGPVKPNIISTLVESVMPNYTIHVTIGTMTYSLCFPRVTIAMTGIPLSERPNKLYVNQIGDVDYNLPHIISGDLDDVTKTVTFTCFDGVETFTETLATMKSVTGLAYSERFLETLKVVRGIHVGSLWEEQNFRLMFLSEIRSKSETMQPMVVSI